MKKDILKIVGIIGVFALIGYVMMYPYEVEPPKDKDIEIVDDMVYQNLDDILNQPDLKGNIVYIQVLYYLYNTKIDSINKLYEKYKDKNVKFVYLYPPARPSSRKKDNTRLWFKILNKYPLKGKHFIIDDVCRGDMSDRKEAQNPKDRRSVFALIANASHKIVDYNAPEVAENEYEAVSKKLDELLKAQKNDTIISK